MIKQMIKEEHRTLVEFLIKQKNNISEEQQLIEVRAILIDLLGKMIRMDKIDYYEFILGLLNKSSVENIDSILKDLHYISR